MEVDLTTPTGWEQDEDPALDSRVLGALAIAIAILSMLCALTYFHSPLAYLGAVVALAFGFLSRSVPRSRRLGTVAVVLAIMACVVATVALVSVGG